MLIETLRLVVGVVLGRVVQVSTLIDSARMA